MSEAILELGAFCVLDAMMLIVPASMIFSILLNVTAWPPTFFLRSKINKQGALIPSMCNEYGTIYTISSDFGDRMTTQSM